MRYPRRGAIRIPAFDICSSHDFDPSTLRCSHFGPAPLARLALGKCAAIWWCGGKGGRAASIGRSRIRSRSSTIVSRTKNSRSVACSMAKHSSDDDPRPVRAASSPRSGLHAAQLQQLLTMLHRSNLLIADSPGQGNELLKRDRQRRAAANGSAAASNFLHASSAAALIPIGFTRLAQSSRRLDILAARQRPCSH